MAAHAAHANHHFDPLHSRAINWVLVILGALAAWLFCPPSSF